MIATIPIESFKLDDRYVTKVGAFIDKEEANRLYHSLMDSGCQDWGILPTIDKVDGYAVVYLKIFNVDRERGMKTVQSFLMEQYMRKVLC